MGMDFHQIRIIAGGILCGASFMFIALLVIGALAGPTG